MLIDSQRSCHSASGSDGCEAGDAGGDSGCMEAGEPTSVSAGPPDFGGSVFTVSHMDRAERRSRRRCL